MPLVARRTGPCIHQFCDPCSKWRQVLTIVLRAGLAYPPIRGLTRSTLEKWDSEATKPTMGVHLTQRESESGLVDAITHAVYDDEPVTDVITPDGLWDIVVTKHFGKVEVIQTGVITRPFVLPWESGDEYLSISFKPGVYMPRMPGAWMTDRAIVRPAISSRAFQVGSDTFEIPTVENADGLVERLASKGIIVRDEIVSAVAEGRQTRASSRTLQRRFRWTLGLTANQLAQIHRARDAVKSLRQGRRAIDVAAELGYADQAHLTRSLRRFMGQSPRAIAGSHPPP